MAKAKRFKERGISMDRCGHAILWTDALIVYVCNHSYSFRDIQIDEGNFVIWNFSLVFFLIVLKIVLDKN